VIIKLGAAGDVLRTTPLLRALNPRETGTKILWVTNHPELVPSEACEPVKLTASTLARLEAEEWDFCWNLDKDVEACAAAFKTRAKEYAGYTLKNGIPWPVDERAWHKYATGIDNDYSKQNTLNYVEEIFDIVGITYQKEEYWIKTPSDLSRHKAAELIPGKNWIGLNTGAGFRWPTRIWPESHWLELIKILSDNGLKPLILGGPEEHEMNLRIAEKSKQLYLGLQSLDVFYALIERCDCLVTSVTQAMHLAIGSKTPLILMNNIFNKNEFELYGRGEVVEPVNPCDCFYDQKCRSSRNCIQEINPNLIASMILNYCKK
jgi:heptosyltransferase-2